MTINIVPVVVAIDDKAKELEVVRIAVRELPYKVKLLTATNELEGLQLIQADPEGIRVVLLDVRMPKLDGRWVYAEIRRLAPHAQIIPYTGDHEAGEQLVELGARPPIYKPASFEDISEALTQALDADAPMSPSTGLYGFLQEQAPRMVQIARNNEASLRVAILSNSSLDLVGLSALITRAGGEVIVETDRSSKVREMANSGRLNVIVCVPEMLNAAQEISNATHVPLLVYAKQSNLDNMEPAPRTSVVVEPISIESFTTALRTIAAGGHYGLPQSVLRLTPKQRRLAQLIATGTPIPEIAEDLGVSVDRVRHMLSDLYRQLNLSGLAEFRSWAQEQFAPRE